MENPDPDHRVLDRRRVMLLATYFTQGLTWNTALLTVLNAVVAALTAMGGYELTFAKIEKKKAQPEP